MYTNLMTRNLLTTLLMAVLSEETRQGRLSSSQINVYKERSLEDIEHCVSDDTNTLSRRGELRIIHTFVKRLPEAYRSNKTLPRCYFVRVVNRGINVKRKIDETLLPALDRSYFESEQQFEIDRLTGIGEFIDRPPKFSVFELLTLTREMTSVYNRFNSLEKQYGNRK